MDSFLGEIRLFGGPFAPQDWAFCDGSLMQIAQYDALYALLGTTYGGDGVTTFGLPDLRGRVPLHRSSATPLGQVAGTETVTLTANQVGKHAHGFLAAKDPANAMTPDLKTPAATAGTDAIKLWSAEPALAPFAPAAISSSGTGPEPHDNMHPYQAITYIISLQGMWPPRAEEGD